MRMHCCDALQGIWGQGIWGLMGGAGTAPAGVGQPLQLACGECRLLEFLVGLLEAKSTSGTSLLLGPVCQHILCAEQRACVLTSSDHCASRVEQGVCADHRGIHQARGGPRQALQAGRRADRRGNGA